MLYLTVGFISLAAYCVALTVVVRREINYVRNSINQCWKSIRRCWNDVDDNADDISDIRHILSAHFMNPYYVMPRCDKDNARIDANENEIQNLKANAEK